MGRYCKYDRDVEAENAARRRNDGTLPSDLLFGSQEEFEYLEVEIPIRREDQESINGTLTGALKYRYKDPNLDFIRAYNGPANTTAAGRTDQTSQSNVPQNFNPTTGEYVNMFRTAAEHVVGPHITVKSKAEALASYDSARSSSYRYQRAEGFKGAKHGPEGKQYCNDNPKPGKPPRGWPKGKPKSKRP